jgi:putative endonuclease
MSQQQIAVYIMSNSRRTIYIGVTNNLLRRVSEPKQVISTGFAERYRLTKLVHYECFDSMAEAIAREKQLKGWLR